MGSIKSRGLPQREMVSVNTLRTNHEYTRAYVFPPGPEPEFARVGAFVLIQAPSGWSFTSKTFVPSADVCDVIISEFRGSSISLSYVFYLSSKDASRSLFTAEFNQDGSPQQNYF